jgi:hypothetical protein
MLLRYFSHKLEQLSGVYDEAAAEQQGEEGGEGEEAQQGGGAGGQGWATDMQTDGENLDPLHGGAAGAGAAGQGAAGAGASPSALLGAAWVARLQGICGALRVLGLQAAAEEAHTAVVHVHVCSRWAPTCCAAAAAAAAAAGCRRPCCAAWAPRCAAPTARLRS